MPTAGKLVRSMAYIHNQRTLTDVPPFPRWSLLVAVAALLAAFAVVLSGHGSQLLLRLEQGAADFRTALFSERLSGDHPDIVIVSVGDNVNATSATFDRRTVDVDRNQLSRLIDAIDDSAPRGIGFDVPLAGATDQIRDLTLQRSLREAKARVVIGMREPRGEMSLERRTWLDRFIQGTGRPVGHISVIYDGARVTGVDSGVQALGPVPDSFALLMARTLRPEARRSFGQLAWLQKVEDGGFLTRFMNVGAQQPFRVLYAQDLLDTSKPLPTRQLAGRIVLVTSGLAEIERHRTPLTIWSGESAAPIQIQAQAIAQMLDGRTITEMQPRSLRLFLFTLACLAGLIGWYRGGGWSVLGTFGALIGLLAMDAMAYTWYGLMLPIVPALLLWLLGEIAGRSLRRILEWEERHGHQWPLEGADAAVLERAARGA
jgi:CHASE2 domain-containing sensor protein